MIGCADVLRGYRDRPRAVIGLLEKPVARAEGGP